MSRTSERNNYLFGREAIAHARLGEQVARAGGITLQLAAQLGHVDTHMVWRIGVSWPPDLLQQLAVRQHLAGVLGQRDQQAVFSRCQVDSDAAEEHLAARQ